MATKPGKTKSKKTTKPSSPSKKTAKTVATPGETPRESKPSKKVKRIRGTFSIPENDYALIGVLKARLKARKLPAKKNQLLRAGLRVLAEMAPLELQEAIESLTTTPRAVSRK